MKVSVIIPAYNEAKYIEKCLNSLKKQTVKPYEIIVVDNNSRDQTSKIARNKKVKVIFEKSQGASFARNAGFNTASGDIILRTDADTIVPNDWIEKMTGHFENPRVGIVCGGVEYYNKWLNPISNALIFWINDVFGYKAITGPNFGIRKSVWEKIKNEVHTKDNVFHEDLDLSIHAQRFGEYVRVNDLMVVSSPRKFSDLSAFFITYPLKWFNTVFSGEHRKLSSNPLVRMN